MAEFDARPLLHTSTVSAWDCRCQGRCRAKAGEEWSADTHICFPRRGVYVHSVGRLDIIADANQAVIINAHQPYQVSHPVPGGDVTLSVTVDRATLPEITPRGRTAPNRIGVHIDTHTQLLAARLHQRMSRRVIDTMEAETQLLQLIRRTLGDTGSLTSRPGDGRTAKMADQAKLLLSTDPSRRWTLAEVAAQIGVGPVYLTDAFRRIEGTPLYRYHLRLRLSRALSLLAGCDDLSTLALELGFTSHSHFSASFKRMYGLTPSAYQRTVSTRTTVSRIAAPVTDPGTRPVRAAVQPSGARRRWS